MDFASMGEVMQWDCKEFVFRPYKQDSDILSEKEIKTILR